MVDVKELGELLKLPDLEAETKALINAKMRELIGDIRPLTGAEKQEVMSVMHEYMYGAAKEGV